MELRVSPACGAQVSRIQINVAETPMPPRLSPLLRTLPRCLPCFSAFFLISQKLTVTNKQTAVHEVTLLEMYHLA